MNDETENLKHSKIRLFADDIILYKEITTVRDAHATTSRRSRVIITIYGKVLGVTFVAGLMINRLIYIINCTITQHTLTSIEETLHTHVYKSHYYLSMRTTPYNLYYYQLLHLHPKYYIICIQLTRLKLN